jgi:hypothetical protein
MKALRKKKLKGHLVFEFMLAVVIFFGIVIYVLNYLNGTMTVYKGEFFSESMKSKATQIGELLVLNKGNWSGGIPTVAGLSEDWPVLNRTKIIWLNSSCNSNYQGFMDNLGVNPGKRLKIVINETRPDGTVSALANCPSQQKVGIRNTEAKRHALVPDASNPSIMNVASIYIYIW